jgi:hypothetical protein
MCPLASHEPDTASSFSRGGDSELCGGLGISQAVGPMQGFGMIALTPEGPSKREKFQLTTRPDMNWIVWMHCNKT